MKVSDLKELIISMNDEGEVHFMMYDGCCSNTLTLEVTDWDRYSGDHAHIYIKAVPGYETCRKSAITQKATKE
jgi:hypothetical protein